MSATDLIYLALFSGSLTLYFFYLLLVWVDPDHVDQVLEGIKWIR